MELLIIYETEYISNTEMRRISWVSHDLRFVGIIMKSILKWEPYRKKKQWID